MNILERIALLQTCHTVQVNLHNDCSGTGRIRKMTKREQLRAYKKLGKEPPAHLKSQPQMKLLKRKTGNG